jgi:hypothetical protein
MNCVLCLRIASFALAPALALTSLACSNDDGEFCPARYAAAALSVSDAKQAAGLSLTGGCQAACVSIEPSSNRCDLLYVWSDVEGKCTVRLDLKDGRAMVAEVDFTRGTKGSCTDVYPPTETPISTLDAGWDAGEAGVEGGVGDSGDHDAGGSVEAGADGGVPEESGTPDASMPDGGVPTEAGGTDAGGTDGDEPSDDAAGQSGDVTELDAAADVSGE